jgi:hypothetical protein
MAIADYQAAPPRNSTLARAIADIKLRFAEHIPLYICAIGFTIIAYALSGAFGVWLSYGSVLPYTEVAILAFLAWFISIAAFRVFTDGFRRVRAFLLHKPRPPDFFPIRISPGAVFHSLATLGPLMLNFIAFKDAIPSIQPFSWDPALARWDRILGFGHQPWQWLQPLLGHPLVTAALAVPYELWIVVMLCVLFWQAFLAQDRNLRLQFLLASALAWFVGGNLIALAFSSAGPCYYGKLFSGPDPFASQMAYLQAANTHWRVLSLDVQAALWNVYATGTAGSSGISAMPSMHLTSTVLMALVAWRTNRKLGGAFWVFAILIFLGSIHLAWHYLTDAISGIALAFLFWAVAGEIVARWNRRDTKQPLLVTAQ